MPNGIAIQKYAWSQKMNRRNGIRSYASGIWENAEWIYPLLLHNRLEEVAVSPFINPTFEILFEFLVPSFPRTLYLYLILKDCVTRVLIMRHLQPIG
ncbi:MAG: hypothetical protein EZS28_029971 [Streblomastix strix]|uniref:Uncharacterized protein n=1 Tax=Streblomastix strix TaxID=222440 RepID=A0A5J4UWP2_9EUKA|nr:MAG: hypothetical protein EZS28_029971 [Streblomastix strix]